eukprot:gnl/MRDRNA2_/MRDRNA2_31356_c0_seq1.p1 gnl/MRDRNA2_/MRDRNA2_31356_c0~~gnl/MRDRNA2_/MRDRNA2_31356_c0_seq1.p1  ORF type:complete len:107 (-),score=17.26 gnl/MRDRNA2_/MRDRNA2_31356_c0_seq1:83-403(-)
MKSKNHGQIWILGIPFLQQYYTVFQTNPKSMHFADVTSNCQPAQLDSQATYFGQVVQHKSPFNQSHRFENGASKYNIRTLGSAAIRLPKWAMDWQEANATTSMPDF